MEASMNVRTGTLTGATREDNPRNNHTNKVTSGQDDDDHAKVLSQGQSFNYKVRYYYYMQHLTYTTH